MVRQFLIIGLILIVSGNSIGETLTNAEIRAGYQKSYAHEHQNEYQEAVQDLKPIYLNYPKTYTVNYRLGWLYYLNHNYANALSHLKIASQSMPESLEVFMVFIRVYAAKADWRRVEEFAVKVLKTDYYHVTGNFWYAYALRMQKKYDLAVKVAQKMLNVYPTSVRFLQILGENYYFNNQKSKAKLIFENLLVLDPTNQTAEEYLKN